MIEFREGQDNIFIRRHKLCKSEIHNHLDFHLVYPHDEESGYSDKFVRIITLENSYIFDTLRNIKTDSFQDEFTGIKYFENGGYLYNKVRFNQQALIDPIWLNHVKGISEYTMDGKPEKWQIVYYPIFEDGKTGKKYNEPRALVEDKNRKGYWLKEVPLRYLTSLKTKSN